MGHLYFILIFDNFVRDSSEILLPNQLAGGMVLSQGSLSGLSNLTRYDLIRDQNQNLERTSVTYLAVLVDDTSGFELQILYIVGLVPIDFLSSHRGNVSMYKSEC